MPIYRSLVVLLVLEFAAVTCSIGVAQEDATLD
jgi:hypothetical protein